MGEGIKTGSISISDYSSGGLITVKDDGYGNYHDMYTLFSACGLEVKECNTDDIVADATALVKQLTDLYKERGFVWEENSVLLDELYRLENEDCWDGTMY